MGPDGPEERTAWAEDHAVEDVEDCDDTDPEQWLSDESEGEQT
jgi:hypothetical protein